MSAILMSVACILGFSLSISFLIGLWALLLIPVSFVLGMKTVSQEKQIRQLQVELWNAHDALLETVANALKPANELPADERRLH